MEYILLKNVNPVQRDVLNVIYIYHDKCQALFSVTHIGGIHLAQVMVYAHMLLNATLVQPLHMYYKKENV